MDVNRVFLALFALLSLAGCRCIGSETQSNLAPEMSHYGGWNALCHAVFLGSDELVQREARDLTGGPLVESSGSKAEQSIDRLSSSLGYLQTTTARSDLLLGLTRAAEACGSCHAAVGALPSEVRPEWSHPTALRWAVYGLVWNSKETPPDGKVPLLNRLAKSYISPPLVRSDTGKHQPTRTEDRLEGLLNDCWSCHQPTADDKK